MYMNQFLDNKSKQKPTKSLLYDSIGKHESKTVFLNQKNTEQAETNSSFLIFKTLTEALDNVVIDEDFELGKSYEIKLGKLNTKFVYQGKVVTKPSEDSPKILEIDDEHSKKVEKLSQTIQIIINPNTFTFKEIPQLIKEIAKTHNEWIDTINKTYVFPKLGFPLYRNKQKQNEQKLWQINPGLIIAKRYLAVAQILDKALNIKQDSDCQPPISYNNKFSSSLTILDTLSYIFSPLFKISFCGGVSTDF